MFNAQFSVASAQVQKSAQAGQGMLVTTQSVMSEKVYNSMVATKNLVILVVEKGTSDVIAAGFLSAEQNINPTNLISVDNVLSPGATFSIPGALCKGVRKSHARSSRRLHTARLLTLPSPSPTQVVNISVLACYWKFSLDKGKTYGPIVSYIGQKVLACGLQTMRDQVKRSLCVCKCVFVCVSSCTCAYACVVPCFCKVSKMCVSVCCVRCCFIVHLCMCQFCAYEFQTPAGHISLPCVVSTRHPPPLPFCLSVFLSFCLSVFLTFCLSIFLSFCPGFIT